jgi:hypothetical protein
MVEGIMKCVIIGLAVFSLATTAWAGVLRDNFNDGDADGWRKFGGKFSILNSTKPLDGLRKRGSWLLGPEMPGGSQACSE